MALAAPVEFDFWLGQAVSIRDLENAPAVVHSINIGTSGVTYEVAWYANGDRKTAYLFADELAPRYRIPANAT